jgi:hypothetical protein
MSRDNQTLFLSFLLIGVRSTAMTYISADLKVRTTTSKSLGTKLPRGISSNGGNKTRSMFYPNSVPPKSDEYNHGLYVIVSVNSLLTLPVTIAVILFICRKFYKKKPKTDLVDPDHVDNDPCYNDLNEFNTCVKVSEYDALSICTEETNSTSYTTNYCPHSAPQRKARENSYVPVRERKPNENDETLTSQDIYSKIRRNDVVVESDHEVDGSITTESVAPQDSLDTLQRSEESLYIVPLVPANEGPGIRIKSSVEMTSSRKDESKLQGTMADGEIYVTVV